MLSVIVPSYNMEKYLADAIESVLAQTYTEWEMIIVDDGSTDISASIAREYAEKDGRIKYIYQDNAGPSAARNHGVKESTGKYLFFFDGDDKITPEYLQLGVSYMEGHQECTFFSTDVEYFGGKTGSAYNRFSNYKNLLCENSLCCCGLIRRTDFERIGGFDENMKGIEDWELFIRLLYKHDNVYIYPKPMFFYRIGNSNSINHIAKKNIKNLTTYIYEKHKEKYLEYWGDPFSAYHNWFYYQTELEKLFDSRTYRFGKMLLTPLRWIKSKL